MRTLLSLIRIDLPFDLYALTVVGAAYGTGLFIWWWWRQGKASAVYGYVTLFFVGTLFRNLLDALACYYRLTDMGKWAELTASPWWAIRLLVTLSAVWAMNIHMTWRVHFGKKED